MHVNFLHTAPGKPTAVVWSAELAEPPRRGEVVLLHRLPAGLPAEKETPFNFPPERYRVLDVCWHYAPGSGDAYVDVPLARMSAQEDLEQARDQALPPQTRQQRLFSPRR